ncbi:MAG: radical SAM family heme chaperone HemW [Candidatus Omnitrophica bacterium]|nr:radical SAM family heme chaperone HemW [Candidatus Omnitrophota bacterium]
MIGLYVHVPFCAKKCHYCNFVITTSRPASLGDSFLAALRKEIFKRAALARGRVFDTLYIGGGTPSVLSEDELKKIFSILRENFKFRADAEITLEANPGDLTAEKARLLRESGVNRVSLGAQSFNDPTLRRLNRSHDAAAIRRSFGILRQEGFQSVNLDLLLSLPEESFEDVKGSLEAAAALGPEHVSLYELTVEEKTKFGRDAARGLLKLPDEDAQIERLTVAREFLKKNGYEHYELLNYARPGFRSRHNLIYWANGEYLGLGPGAFSYLGGARSRLASSVEEYLRKIKMGDWRPAESERLSPEKKEIESFLLALRLTEGADVGATQRVAPTAIQKLKENGLIEETTGKIHLTPRGQFFAETVFAELC